MKIGRTLKNIKYLKSFKSEFFNSTFQRSEYLMSQRKFFELKNSNPILTSLLISISSEASKPIIMANLGPMSISVGLSVFKWWMIRYWPFLKSYVGGIGWISLVLVNNLDNLKQIYPNLKDYFFLRLDNSIRSEFINFMDINFLIYKHYHFRFLVLFLNALAFALIKILFIKFFFFQLFSLLQFKYNLLCQLINNYQKVRGELFLLN